MTNETYDVIFTHKEGSDNMYIDYDLIGQRIREARRKKGWSLDKLSEEIDVAVAYLSRVVGIRKGIKNGYIWGLCLGVLGFIVVCALKEDTNVSGKNNIDNKYDEIEKLNGLKIKGVLTAEEFEIEKNKILKDFKY